MSYFTNIQMFVRVFELGSMSAAARDLGVSAAVASARIGELEKHLGTRLFNRTTRTLLPTEHGSTYYKGALNILESVALAEAEVAELSGSHKGTIFAAAPLGIGRRFIAPSVPIFKQAHPGIDVRLRLTDHSIDIAGEGVDVAFALGTFEDSTVKRRKIAECERVLCASPSYVSTKGHPENGEALAGKDHDCLLMRFPGCPDHRWNLVGADGKARPYNVKGPFESDDGDVLTEWALAGHGIINKPLFEVAEYLERSDLVVVCEKTPPVPVELVCLYPHRRFLDPKLRLFIDFMSQQCRQALSERTAPQHMQTAL
ncbi:LysR family transcriptional regulator [Rhodobacteraceae bacterium RKSG542]|uniref:LysR family transcriptional regulator n=1 Tax=Pseudovibrio flavus TaxID=2529854 RepID=UPI0012BD6F46|nr:LysR family transcriptional regulator [Pseudovibrio flavus]MTI15886.1 LysR family transcriptional regulator [Pseudovibrio flavus]